MFVFPGPMPEAQVDLFDIGHKIIDTIEKVEHKGANTAHGIINTIEDQYSDNRFEKDVERFFTKIYGRACIQGLEQCSVISYCNGK